jgi:hypothetical protein
VLVDDDPDLHGADQLLLVGLQSSTISRSVARSAAQLGDQCAVRAGDDVRMAIVAAPCDTIGTLCTPGRRTPTAPEVARRGRGTARCRPVPARSPPPRSPAVGVEVLTSTFRGNVYGSGSQNGRSCANHRTIPGEQTAQPCARVQPECLGGQSSLATTPPRPRPDLAAAATTPGRHKRSARAPPSPHRVEDVHSLLVCDRDPSMASEGAPPASSSHACAAAPTAAFRASGAVVPRPDPHTSMMRA